MDVEFKEITAAFREKARLADLTSKELKDFECSNLHDVEIVLASIQKKQLHTKRLRYIKRIQPFIELMSEYGKVIDIFVNTSEILAFVWGPLKFILMVASTLPEAFESLLKAYQELAEDIPLLSSYSDLFSQNPQMRLLLVAIYEDIMKFHLDAMKYFRQKLWKQLFQAAWRGFGAKITLIRESLRRKKKLIESRAFIVQYEEIKKLLEETQNTSKAAEAELEERKKKDIWQKRQAVHSWLSPPSMESIHERHIRARSQDPESGRWLLEKPLFQQWLHPIYSITNILWLNGKPGAGKTVLASLVVEEIRKLPNVSAAFCYCAHGDPERDNFLSIARTLLSQLLAEAQNDNLLDLFYEKMSTSGETILSRSALAKELLEISIAARKSYIILDGIDECSREERKEICTWFRLVADGPPDDIDIDIDIDIRCLFVCQDDGAAGKDLSMIPSLSITIQDNKNDIRTFCQRWQRQIEERFGSLGEFGLNITDLVTARSYGMFIFARCVLEELYQQPSRKALLDEWSSDMFPDELDQVYAKILRRVMGSGVVNRQKSALQLLSWISCSKRPLKWYEIQGAASMNLEDQKINDEDLRLVDDSKGLCASLVEVQPDQTVDFVHNTVRTFLKRKGIVDASQTDRDMCLLSMRYLSFPSLQAAGMEPQAIREELLLGQYSFYEYAVACWVPHLTSWLAEKRPGEKDVSQIGESIEIFLSLHYLKNGTRQTVSKSMDDRLQPLQVLDQYDSLAQAVVWSRKLVPCSASDKGSDLLDFPQTTKEWRSVLEELVATGNFPDQKSTLDRYYGTKLFKCPRVYCQYFHLGFESLAQRDKHVDRHKRAYTCTFEGCPRTTFGYAFKTDVDNHLQTDHGIFNDASDFPNIRKRDAEQDDEDKPTGRYKCTYCPKTFTQSFNLKSHLVTHTRERAFVCGTCQKAFGRAHDMKRHQWIHTRDLKPADLKSAE